MKKLIIYRGKIYFARFIQGEFYSRIAENDGANIVYAPNDQFTLLSEDTNNLFRGLIEEID